MSSLHKEKCDIKTLYLPQKNFRAVFFNAQAVSGNDMACKRCKTSTYIKYCDIDIVITETWLRAHDVEAKNS